MTPEELAAQIVKPFEGLHLTWYHCPSGEPTVGWGHVILPTEKELWQPITQQRADSLLISDLHKAALSVSILVHKKLTLNQTAALISFVFNVGFAAFKGSAMLRKINAGDFESALREFPRWVHDDHGNELPGLVRRRNCEKLIFSGTSIDELVARNWLLDSVLHSKDN